MHAQINEYSPRNTIARQAVRDLLRSRIRRHRFAARQAKYDLKAAERRFTAAVESSIHSLQTEAGRFPSPDKAHNLQEACRCLCWRYEHEGRVLTLASAFLRGTPYAATEKTDDPPPEMAIISLLRKLWSDVSVQPCPWTCDMVTDWLEKRTNDLILLNM